MLNQDDNYEPLLYGIDLNTNRLAYIEDVPNGRACNCICPKCKCLLEARNQGAVRMHSFSHYTELKAHHKGGAGSGLGNCNVNSETIIHRAAKELFEDINGSQIELPPEVFSTFLEPIVVRDARTVMVDHVETEVSYQDVRPDVIIHTTEGETIFLEVFVTHPVTEEKRSKLRNIGIPCIEVDLRDISIDNGIPFSELKELLLTNNPKRKWIYTPKLDALYKKRRLFDKVFCQPPYTFASSCLLLPWDKKEEFFRCYTCPFFAGQNGYFAYCSAFQLLNMNDIQMGENDVKQLVEQIKEQRIQEHFIYEEERQRKEAEMVAMAIKSVEDAISAIGDVSLNSKMQINTARQRYNSLPVESQNRVSNYAALVSAENFFNTLIEQENKLRAETAQVNEMEKTIHVLVTSNARYQSYYWEDQVFVDSVLNAKNTFDSLSESIQSRVKNRELLFQLVKRIETEEERRDKERQADQKRKADIDNLISASDYKKKRIVQTSEGAYVIEGECPVNKALQKKNMQKYYMECIKCALCEHSTEMSGPNQFIVCNGCDNDQLNRYLKIFNN